MLDDVEAVLEKAELAVAARQLLQQRGNVLPEARDLVDERGDEEIGERGHCQQGRAECDADGGSAARNSPLEHAHERLECHRQHDGDDELDEDRAGRVGEEHEERRAECDCDEDDDRACRDDDLRGPGLRQVKVGPTLVPRSSSRS